MSVDFSPRGSARFVWKLVNNHDTPLLRADFRFVPGARVTSPLEGSTYNGPSGCSYVVDLVGGPNAGIAFLPSDDHPIQDGQWDMYPFTAMREDLSSNTVLWGSAETTGGDFGRFDIRAGMCFSMPSRKVTSSSTAFDALLALLIAALAATLVTTSGRWRAER